MNISQSLIKAFEEYAFGESCGKQFQALYIDKSVSFEPSEAMLMGIWFEYLITGEKMRDGTTPLPDLYKGADIEFWKTVVIPEIKKGVSLSELIGSESKKLKSKYLYLYYQAIMARKSFLYYGFSEIQSGVVWEYETSRGTKTKGILDVLAIRNKKKAIVDIKSTGMINNKWEEFGWDTDTLHHKQKLMLQAIHYKWMGIQLFNEDIPFYFFVHGNTNVIDRKIIRVDVSKGTMDRYAGLENDDQLSKVDFIQEMVDYNIGIGFESRPDVNRCSKCPLKDDCKDFIDIPRIITISV